MCNISVKSAPFIISYVSIDLEKRRQLLSESFFASIGYIFTWASIFNDIGTMALQYYVAFSHWLFKKHWLDDVLFTRRTANKLSCLRPQLATTIHHPVSASDYLFT